MTKKLLLVILVGTIPLVVFLQNEKFLLFVLLIIIGALAWDIMTGNKDNYLGKYAYIVLVYVELIYFASYTLCDTRGLEGGAHCYAGFFSPVLEETSSFFVMAGWAPPIYLLLFAPLVYSLVHPLRDIRSCYRQYKQQRSVSNWLGFFSRPTLWYAILFLCFQVALLFLIPVASGYGDQKAYEQKSEKIAANQALINETSELYERTTALVYRRPWNVLQTVTIEGVTPRQSSVVIMDGRILRLDNPDGISCIDRFGEYYLVGEGGKTPFQSSEYVSGKTYFFSGNGSMDLEKIVPHALEKGFFARELLSDVSFTRTRQAEHTESPIRDAWIKENENSFHFQSITSSQVLGSEKYSEVRFENEKTDHPRMTLTTLGGKNIQLEFTPVLDINEALRFSYEATEVR